MTEKVCPRCGSMYEDMKSTTCPQCFAKLVEVDLETASEFKAARAEVERTPEFQEAKVADDERFREQTFGACVAVIAIAVITVIVIIVVISIAARRGHHGAKQYGVAQTTNGVMATSMVDSPMPTAAASIDDLLPKTVGTFTRMESDSSVTLPGTMTHVFHGAYRAAIEKEPLDAYVISTGASTSEQSAFLSGIAIASQRGSNASGHPRIIFATQHWRYAVIGPATDSGKEIDQFQGALSSYFQRFNQ